MSQLGWCKLFVVLFVCLFIACNKKNASTPVDAGLKKYFSYKPGTYWIYYDSVNLETDSFAVTGNYVQSISDNSGNSYDYETDNIIAYKNGVDSFSSVWYLYKSFIHYQYDSWAGTINYDPLFSFPYTQTYQSYVLNNNTYNSVLEDDNAHNLQSSSNDTFLISPNAGIIKMFIHHQKDTVYMTEAINYRWTLVRFKIEH